MTNNILVFAEQRNGKLHPGALQCFAPAKDLAAQTGGQVVACLIGSNVDACTGPLELAGAARIISISDPALEHYSATRYRTALGAAVQKVHPKVVLLAATFMGRDLAPRVAIMADGTCATDVVELKLEDDAIHARRPVFNGKAFSTVALPNDKPAFVSIRNNTFTAPSGGSGAEQESLPFTAGPADDRMTTTAVEKTGGDEKDVTEADIIVSGGRSLKNEDNFKILYDLAHALDGAVGASRAACDAGYQPHSRQVGLTGKTVTPKLYIACGISGAPQHRAGLRDPRYLLAINTDAEAPIFRIATWSVVGDARQILPAWIRLLKDAAS